jgi:hypothetical protein
MTASSDRLDRIEVLVEKNSKAIENNSRAIQKLTEESKELTIRFAVYQQASQWVGNLAFGLLATATITTIVAAVIR